MKMPTKRLSPTLLDSFRYYLKIEDEERSQQARTELLARLKGEKSLPNEAMRIGIAFEDNVVEAIRGHYIPVSDDEKYDKCVYEIAKSLKGSIYQCEISVVAGDVLIEGCADFLKHNRIIDVKTTRSYKVGKYYNNTQHLAYLLAKKDDGITKFRYLISDLKNVYKEDYTWLPSMEHTLRDRINEFLCYLQIDNEMNEAYQLYCKRDAGYKNNNKEINVLI